MNLSDRDKSIINNEHCGKCRRYFRTTQEADDHVRGREHIVKMRHDNEHEVFSIRTDTPETTVSEHRRLTELQMREIEELDARVQETEAQEAEAAATLVSVNAERVLTEGDVESQQEQSNHTTTAPARIRTEIAWAEESITKAQQEQSNRDKEMAFRIRLEEIDLECLQTMLAIQQERRKIRSISIIP